MNYTEKLGLKKPEGLEFVLVEDLNENFDILDTEIAKITDEETGVEATLTKHLDESMPHRFEDNGVQYRWGFRTVNGEPQFIYEEVTV